MNTRSQWVLLVSAGVNLVGCSRVDSDPARFIVQDSSGVEMVSNFSAGGWSPESAPSVVEELRIGEIEGAPEYLFGSIISVDVDAEGNIYVVDLQTTEVRVFDSSGTHLRTMGRSGSGPGELLRPFRVVALEQEALIVDLGNRRLQRYDGDGRDAGIVSLPNGVSQVAQLDPSGDLIEQWSGAAGMAGTSMAEVGPFLPNDILVRRNLLAETVDTLLVLPPNETVRIVNGSTFVPTMYAATPIWTVAHGNVLVARSTEMRVEMHTPDGALVRVFTLDLPPVPINDETRERLLTAIGGMGGGNAEVLPHLPIVMSMFEGPHGTIWVRSPIADIAGSPTELAWHIFDSEGRFLGPLRLDNFEPLGVEADRVYGVGAGDLGVQYVARLRIDGL